jgi:two-component system cell cycle sensor histidine kinase/response regulator CckA
VYSEEGHGTTFKIYLPRHRADIPREAAVLRETVDLPAGDETILLVEDDERVRSLARQVLQDRGYTVLEAQNGLEALQVSANHTGPIHLLLTDVVMPGMSSKTLAEQLAQARPGLKVLFISGYTDNTIMQHGVIEPGVALLQKPFGPMTLTSKVRAVLNEMEGFQ